MLACIGLVVLVIAALAAGYAFNRWGKKLLTKHDPSAEVTQPDATPTAVVKPSSTPAPIPGLPSSEPMASDPAAALREAHLAQDAAEQLSRMLHNAEVNQQLIALVQARPNFKPEDIEQYRRSEDAIERSIIDAETGYLLAAKRLAKIEPDTLRAAFDKLEDEVSTAGIGWRTKLAQIIRRHVLKVQPFDTRVDSDFRTQLKGLQKD